MMTQNDDIIMTLAYHHNALITLAGIKPSLEINQWLRVLKSNNFPLNLIFINS